MLSQAVFYIPRRHGNAAAFWTGHNPFCLFIDFLRMRLSRFQLSAANRERAASLEMNYRLIHSCHLTPEWQEALPENGV
jgi:hypothetical protein